LLALAFDLLKLSPVDGIDGKKQEDEEESQGEQGFSKSGRVVKNKEQSDKKTYEIQKNTFSPGFLALAPVVVAQHSVITPLLPDFFASFE
jgi:hypothetical protein